MSRRFQKLINRLSESIDNTYPFLTETEKYNLLEDFVCTSLTEAIVLQKDSNSNKIISPEYTKLAQTLQSVFDSVGANVVNPATHRVDLNVVNHLIQLPEIRRRLTANRLTGPDLQIAKATLKNIKPIYVRGKWVLPGITKY